MLVLTGHTIQEWKWKALFTYVATHMITSLKTYFNSNYSDAIAPLSNLRIAVRAFETHPYCKVQLDGMQIPNLDQANQWSLVIFVPIWVPDIII